MKIVQTNFKGDSTIKSNFKALCKKHDVDMDAAFNVFMETCHINNINPKEIDLHLSQNVNTTIMKYHNYTVSFLQSFEKSYFNRLEFYQASNTNYFEDLNKKMEIILRKNNIEKAVINEILFNSQLLLDMEDKELGKSVYEKNYAEILKTEKLNELNNS
jgi:antitoxin component of RelBE/YafQ-DinJ toxin-antitoxin module